MKPFICDGLMLVLLVLAGVAERVLAQPRQGTQPSLTTPMPYTAIHQPEFVTASEATFLQDDDILLGVTSRNVARRTPRPILRSTARCSIPCLTVLSR